MTYGFPDSRANTIRRYALFTGDQRYGVEWLTADPCAGAT